MKMFELIPYMLELDYDSEIRIIEDLEHDDGELPRLMDVVPSIMLNTITGKKTFALIKKEAMDRYYRIKSEKEGKELIESVEKKRNDLEKQVQQQNININHNIHITIEDESW